MGKPVVLLIGGLDPQGCAGISADLVTVVNHHCHGLPLVTAMTQQTSAGLQSFGAVDASQLMAQYNNCMVDFTVQAIKIGLIPSLEVAQVIATIIDAHADVPIVLDPVLATTSGGQAVPAEVHTFIIENLVPKVSLLTPNLNELSQLVPHVEPHTAVQQLLAQGLSACFLKGGHDLRSDYASDYFAMQEAGFYLYQYKQQTKNVRGTGCALASAITAQLAHQQDIRDAVVLAKAYISRGIRLADAAGPYLTLYHSGAEIGFEDMPKLCYDKQLIGQQFSFPSCAERLGIYPVVDSYDWIQKLTNEAVPTLQLRVKAASNAEIDTQIAQSLHAVEGSNTALFINDHWEQAIAHQAYGVHLGQEDLHDANLAKISEAGLRLGISTHSYWELARALAVNPSYIALGPIYATTSKQMPFAPQGIERLKVWLRLLKGRYPVVAIGGIDADRVAVLKKTGVGSVAMISAITQADDYQTAVRDLLASWCST